MKHFAANIVALVVSAVSVLAQTEQSCPASQPYGFCCESLEPFSSNSYVWTNICGITGVAPNTPTGSFCGAPGTCYDDIIPVCCESVATCQSGVDGPIALNCTRVAA